MPAALGSPFPFVSRADRARLLLAHDTDFTRHVGIEAAEIIEHPSTECTSHYGCDNLQKVPGQIAGQGATRNEKNAAFRDANLNSPVKSWADDVQEARYSQRDETDGVSSAQMTLWVHVCGHWHETLRAIEPLRSIEERSIDHRTRKVGLGDIGSRKIRAGQVRTSEIRPR